jgi:hypothetical protein
MTTRETLNGKKRNRGGMVRGAETCGEGDSDINGDER